MSTNNPNEPNSPKEKNVLVTIWSFFRNVGYLFVILILAYVVFNGTGQSRDFVLAFVDSSQVAYYVSVSILLFFWSYITWYSACIILEISPVNAEFINEKLAERFCLFMGFTPCIIMSVTFFSAEYITRWQAVLFGSIAILEGVICIIIFNILDKLNADKGKWPGKDDVLRHITNERGEERTPTFLEEIRFMLRYPNVAFYLKYLGTFFGLLLIILCFTPPLIWISRTLMPAGILMLSLSFLTYAWTLFYYLHDIKTRPFVLFVIIWLLFCSRFNDNTNIPKLNSFKDSKDFRLTPVEAYKKWHAKKIALWKDSAKPMPVVFIATQGGGIRGEIWTSEVLHELQRLYPNFYQQVFCIGGASGGTVGAVYYNTFVYDSLKNKNGNANINFGNYIEFTKADCISPVTASFIFGENVQRFWPCPIPCLERSKVMMAAFSKSYHEHLRSGLIDSSFLAMYYPNDDSTHFNCDIPSLFVNGVLAETGQRIITSDLKITDNDNFKSDIDFFDKTRSHASISTVALNCMRFPLLLSGGLITKTDDRGNKFEIGHLVDGGYRENSGLQAMYSLMTDLSEYLKDTKVKPILIYIRNGGLEYKVDKENSNSAMRLLHDIGTPVSGLININGTSVPAFGIVQMIRQQVKAGNPLNMYYDQVWLKDTLYEKINQSMSKTEDNFPLGLYISEPVFKRLERRAKQISVVNEGLIDTLGHYFN